MIKASPTEMRKCLEAVKILKDFGLAFIPIPYETEEEKGELLELSNNKFDEMIKSAEQTE